MIEEFVEYICGLLNIEVPEVRILKEEARSFGVNEKAHLIVHFVFLRGPQPLNY